MAHEGRSGEAVDSLIAAIRLHESVAGEPTMIHQLVRTALVAMSSQTAAEVARRCALSHAQTRRIDHLLARVDLIPGFTAACKGERTLGIWVFREARGNPDIVAQLSGGERHAGWQRALDWTYLKTVGRPILCADLLTYLRLMREEILFSWLPYRESTQRIQRFDAEVRAVPRAFFLTAVCTPEYGGAAKLRGEAVARVNGTRILIALHLYRRQHGAYPEHLSGLASTLNLARLLDPFSHRPFKYERQGKGFLLYSIGANLKDDGGIDTSGKTGGRYEGDIVWRG